MQVEQQPLTALNQKEASYQAKLTAYGSLKGAIASFQTAVKGLNDPTKFQTFKASVADSTLVTASAVSTAAGGNYALNVSKIAQPQSLVVAGQASASVPIGSGTATTLTFDFGAISGGSFTAYNSASGSGGTYSGAAFTSNGAGSKTVTIDSSNNSLTGIRDAINSAGIGVTASIINDGSSAPYRLVLSANTTGKTNSLRLSVSGDASLSGLLTQDPAGTQQMQETISAQNTEMTINGVFVSKSGATVADAIKGVTLNALKTGSTTLSVARDTAGASAAVSGFVKAYNDLGSTLKNLTTYDAATKKAAVLLGDATARGVQSQIRLMLGSPVSNSGAFSVLSQVGISYSADGALALDSAKLQAALSASPNDVAALFAATGRTSDSLVSYMGSSAKTQPGSYALTVSQLATQGSLAGSSPVGSLTIASGVNDTLNITLDGVSSSVTLSAKTYSSAAELALEVQSKINGASEIAAAGSSVSVGATGSTLTLTSSRYGAASTVSVSGTAASNLLGSAPAATAGVDVAGSMNGVAASGSGQFLSGASDNSADGLKLLINAGSTGSRGTVSFSQGYAYRLNGLLENMLSSSGSLSSATEGINRSVKDIGNQRSVINRRLTDVEARYRKQFTTLDTLLSSMNQTSAYLTQQLSSIANLTKQSNA